MAPLLLALLALTGPAAGKSPAPAASTASSSTASSSTASSSTASSSTASSSTESSPTASSPTASSPTDGTAGPRRQRVLVLEVTGELDASARATLTSMIATELARFDTLEVVSRSDVTRMLELEGERQAAGCEDDGACLAELVGALDAEYAAVARAGRVGGTTVFTLQLVDRKGATVGRSAAEVSALDDLVGRVRTAALDVGRQVTGKEPTDAASVSPTMTTMTTMPLGEGLRMPLLVGGGAAAAVGSLLLAGGALPAVLYGNAASDLRVLRARYVDEDDDDARQALLRDATTRQREAEGLRRAWNDVGIYAVWAGVLVAGAGAGALAAGLLLEEGPSP